MAADKTAVAAAIREYVTGMVTSANTTQTPLRNLAKKMPGNGDYFKWLTKYSNNASTTTYSEGAALSAAGNASVSKASLASSTGYIRTVYQITGHAMDAARGGNYDVLMTEADSAIEAHNRYAETLAITAIEAAVDSDSTYASLTRATVNWASYEASIGTLALSDIDTMYDTLAGSTTSAPVENMVFLADQTVIRKVANLSTAASNRPLNFTSGAMVDGSTLAGGLEYNGCPFVRIPGMTSSTLLFVDPSLVWLVQFRAPQIDIMAKTDDSDVFSITSAELLVYGNPRFGGKLTDI